jgi:dihydrofolate synthase / folylpolyglutamate synthase
LAAKRPSAEIGFGSLADWLAWQESLHVTDIELGLDRCRFVANRMGLQAPGKTIVTVAGTNGKGSSVAMLDAIWRAAGLTVGTYTSPHLLAYNERICVDGNPVSDDHICSAFQRIEFARGTTPLTYFEFGTLAALLIFSDAALDVAILEVGLGGRLDAVNIIDADVALISAIGIDHVEFLGDSRESIGLEKAGIMRAGKPAVCSDIDLSASIKQVARELPTRLEVLGDSYRYADDGALWSWWSGNVLKTGLPKPNLAGDHQLRNAAGVLKVVDLLQDRLPVSDGGITRGLREIKLPGRFERLPGAVEMILDVAHNAQAVDVFVGTLAELPVPRRTHVLLGMLRVKDRDGVIRLLEPVADTWHLATVVARRGATCEELHESLRRVVGKATGVRTYASVADAYHGVATIAEPGDRIVALGSFLVVSEVIECRCEGAVLDADDLTGS